MTYYYNFQDRAPLDLPVPSNVFEAMIAGRIRCQPLYEDLVCASVMDSNPQAPVHFLVFPKDNSLVSLTDMTAHHEQLFGHMILVAKEIALKFGLDSGFRLVINDGILGGQTVNHVAVHVMGGRIFTWPPG